MIIMSGVYREKSQSVVYDVPPRVCR